MTIIESRTNYYNQCETFDWEIPSLPDLADFIDDDTAYEEALDAIVSAFEEHNDISFGWEAMTAFKEEAKEFYNSNR